MQLSWRQKIHRLTLFNITRLLLALYVLLSGLKLLSYAYNIIRAPFPLELREGAVLSTTHLLLEGRNPFAAENLPQYLNVYGIIYNLTAVPFARLLGDTLPIHRLLTVIYLALAITFLTAVMIRKQGQPLFAIAAGLCVLANQLYSVTPLTRPDGLGFLLYVLAALLPWDQNFSRRSLVVSAILAVLAFYTKLYFFLAVIYVAVYLFLQVSKGLAIFYTGLTTALLLAAALLLDWLYPYYFYATFFMAVYQPIYSLKHMLFQFHHLGYLYAGMLGILLLAMAMSARSLVRWLRMLNMRELPRRTLAALDLRHLSAPLLAFPLNYPLMALVIAVLVVALKLGGHNGSKMVYLFHLISPLLVVVVVQQAGRLQRLKFAACLLLGLTLALNLRQIGIRPYSLDFRPSALINAPERYLPNWARMDQLLKPHARVLNAPIIAGLLIQDDKPVVDNGHTQYFHAQNIPTNPFLPPPKQIHKLNRQFHNDLFRKIHEHEFDLVAIDREESPFVDQETLRRYYRFDQEVELYAIQNREHFYVEVWTPK